MKKITRSNLIQITLLFCFILLWACVSLGCGKIVQNEREKALAKQIEAVRVYTDARFKNFSADSLQLAMDLISESIMLDSTFVLAYQTKMHFFADQNRYEDALKVINSAFNHQLEKEHPILLFNRGILYEKLRQTKLAEADFTRARPLYDKWIEKHPDDFDALTLRATLTLLTDGVETGRQAYKKLLSKSQKETDSKKVEMLLNGINGKSRDEIIESIVL